MLLGNAVFAGSGTVNLFAADETPVIQGDPVEATGYDGEYNEEVVINRSGEYVDFFNKERPSFALDYLTPAQYKERYWKPKLPAIVQNK